MATHPDPHPVRFSFLLLNLDNLPIRFSITRVPVSVSILLLTYFFGFVPATPLVSRPKLLKLDFCLCPGGIRATNPSLLAGLKGTFGTSGRALSFTDSAILLEGWCTSSALLGGRWLRFPLSCTLLNFSSSSPHRMTLSSLAFKRLGLSYVAVGVCGGLPWPA